MKVRNILLLVAMLVLVSPCISRADDDDDDDRDHQTGRAPEMAMAGQLAAGLAGVASYLAIRRRAAANCEK